MASSIFNDMELTSASIKKGVKRAINKGFGKPYPKEEYNSRLHFILISMIRQMVDDGKIKYTKDLTSVNERKYYKVVYDLYKGYDVKPPLCRICNKNKVDWNERSLKYYPICDDPKCIATAKEEYSNNMIKVHGTDNLANTHEGQVNMQKGRAISKEYLWSDGSDTKTCLGMIEYKTLEALDTECKLPSNRIKVPCPFFIHYKLPEDNGERKHIPDIFDSELNLIISCKDGIDNPNRSPHFQKDRLKSICEFMSILHNTKYNFVQIEGEKEIKDIPEIIKRCTSVVEQGGRFIIPPRIDFMLYGEAEMDMITNKCNFICVVDSDHEVVLSYFSDGVSDRGFIIVNENVIYINADKLLNKNTHIMLTLELNKSFVEVLNIMRKPPVKDNYSLLYYLCNGVIPDHDVVRRGYAVRVKDIIDISYNSCALVKSCNLLTYNEFDLLLKSDVLLSMDIIEKDFENSKELPINIIMVMKDATKTSIIYFIIYDTVIKYDTITHHLYFCDYDDDIKSEISGKDNIKCYTKNFKQEVVYTLYALSLLSQKTGENIVLSYNGFSMDSAIGLNYILANIITKVSMSLIYDTSYSVMMKDLFNMTDIFSVAELTNILVSIINHTDMSNDKPVKSLDCNITKNYPDNKMFEYVKHKIRLQNNIINDFIVSQDTKSRAIADIIKIAYTIEEERSHVMSFLLNSKSPQQ